MGTMGTFPMSVLRISWVLGSDLFPKSHVAVAVAVVVVGFGLEIVVMMMMRRRRRRKRWWDWRMIIGRRWWTVGLTSGY